MPVTLDDVWMLIFYFSLFVAWAAGFSKGGQR